MTLTPGPHLDTELLNAVRTLHSKENRYSTDDGDTSYPTEDEALTADPGATINHTFDICTHCGDLESEYRPDYRDSIWPCATASAAAQSGTTALAAANRVIRKVAGYLEERQAAILRGDLPHQTTLQHLNFLTGALAILDGNGGDTE